jgi:hypothetical protein
VTFAKNVAPKKMNVVLFLIALIIIIILTCALAFSSSGVAANQEIPLIVHFLFGVWDDEAELPCEFKKNN